jgi:chromosome segregation ATPase
MCYAVRYQIERDLVVDLFRNLTFSQLLNNNILRNHTQEMFTLHAQEMLAWKDVATSQSSLKSKSDHLIQLSHVLDTNLHTISRNMTSLTESLSALESKQADITNSMQKWKVETQNWIEKTVHETELAFSSLTQVVTSVSEVRNSVQNVAQTQHNLQSIITSAMVQISKL